jgi:hypothetical protein
MASDRDKVLAALAHAGAAGLTQTEINTNVFGRHRTQAVLGELLGSLATEGRVTVETERGRDDRPTLRWREKANSHVRPEPVVEMEVGPPEPNGAAWTPPDGAGWVPWKHVVYIAEAGVPRGYALRQGRRMRERKRRRNTTAKTVEPTMTDEQYGIRQISREALRKAVDHGFIERRGDWARLLRNPVVTQRPWMEAAFAILGKAHPTLSGEFTPKPPKTLVSVKEAALGRRLLPEEFVKREPGYAGTWDPEHIEIRVRMPHTSSVTEMEKFLAAYRDRVADAPRIVEPRQFEVNLPKNRRS